jgi:hypothetical protein
MYLMQGGKTLTIASDEGRVALAELDDNAEC